MIICLVVWTFSWQITSAMLWEFCNRVHLLVSLLGLRRLHQSHQQLPMKVN